MQVLMSNPTTSTLNPEALPFTPLASFESLTRLDSPTLRGHPHEQASPQLTEPFWQQQPEVAHEPAYWYPQLDRYTSFPLYLIPTSGMDTTPVVIGYDSKVSRPVTDGARGPREMVKVYNENAEVGDVALSTVLRFSKRAKNAFPRPQPTAEGKSTAQNASDQAVKNRDGSEKKWSDVVSPKPAQPATMSARPTSTSTAKPSEPSSPKRLDVAVIDAWVQPSVKVIRHIMNWMDQNSRIRNDKPLLLLTPTDYTKISLKALIDVYTGVLAFDLQPFPHPLRHEILSRLSDQSAQRDIVELLYTRLPPHDPIINRMVTSYFEHKEKGNYTEAEMKAIQDYANLEVEDEGQLARHYRRVEARRSQDQKRQAGLSKLREGFAAFAEDVLEALPPPAAQNTQVSGQPRRRRDRRQQQRDGKAKTEAAKASSSKAN